jgi:undecaprenyl-diphosphatase
MLSYIKSLDKDISLYFYQNNSELFTDFFKAITHMADAIPLILFTVALVIFLNFKGLNKKIPILILSLLGSVCFTHILKLIVRRERPSFALFQEFTYAFPSGHATASASFYGFILYIVFLLYPKRISLKVLLILLIILISFSRIYLNLHYLSDVITGGVIGFTFLIFLIKRLTLDEKCS